MKQLFLSICIIVIATFCACDNYIFTAHDGYSYTADDISGVLDGSIGEEYTENGKTYVYISVGGQGKQLKHPHFAFLPGVSALKDEMPISDYKYGDYISFRITHIYDIVRTSEYEGGILDAGPTLLIVGRIELSD